MSRRFPRCLHCGDRFDTGLSGRGHGLSIPLNGHTVPCAASWCDQGKQPLPTPQLGDAA